MNTQTTLDGAALDALPTQLAVLDDGETILRTNRAWRQFDAENRGPADPTGLNYLAVPPPAGRGSDWPSPSGSPPSTAGRST